MREHLSAEEFPGEGMAEAWYSTIAVGARKLSNVVKRALKAASRYTSSIRISSSAAAAEQQHTAHATRCAIKNFKIKIFPAPLLVAPFPFRSRSSR